MKIKNIIFACLLSVSVLFTAGSSAKTLVSNEEGKRFAFYHKALYEAGENMTRMQAALKKLTVVNSKGLETEYLTRISGYATAAQNSLAALPVGINEFNETMKFVNQAGDYSLSLVRKISKGGALTVSDRENIRSLTEASARLCESLRETAEAFAGGEAVFESHTSTEPSGFESLIYPKEEFPTLLYDGPFSESMLERRMKGLGEKEVTIEEAGQALADFLGMDTEDIRFLQETGGDEKTYVFQIGDGEKEAAVTRRGGKVLYLLSEEEHKQRVLPVEACIRRAQTFLREKGFGETHAGYYRVYEGAVTVNLAPVENGVILYPDLIKIEVEMAEGNIIGFEFTNYYMNHAQRDVNSRAHSMKAGDDYAGMSVLSVRHALIPLDTTEKMTYEIHVKDMENEYLIYMDQETQEEIMLYEVVHTPDGIIVQ